MTNKEIEKFWQEKYEQGCLVLNGTQKLAVTAESVRLHQLDIDIEKWESHLKDKV